MVISFTSCIRANVMERLRRGGRAWPGAPGRAAGGGGQLASPDPDKVAQALRKAAVGDEHVVALEQAIDANESALPALTGFILPGGTPKASALHVARTVCRRAERRVVTLSAQAAVPPVILPYLNRLSDLLFVLARRA